VYAETAAHDAATRARILQSLPSCMRGTTAGAIAAIPPPIHAAEDSRVTISTGPLLPIAGMLMRGFAGDLRVEVMIRPQVAVAVTGLGFHVTALLSEDVTVSGILGTAEARVYMRRFSGGYVGAGPAVAHASNSSGTGLFGGTVAADNGTAFGGTATIGWKWVRPKGSTQSLQLGLLGLYLEDELTIGPQFSWHVGWSQ
jgi:hypothetical protein